MNWGRAVLVWAAIIPCAIANGILRDAVLARVLAAAAARALSGVLLSAAILALTLATYRWLGSPRGPAAVGLGAVWLALTVAFEFAFGRLVAGRSWDELFRAYRFEGGDLWPVVLLVVAVAPLLASMILRRH